MDPNKLERLHGVVYVVRRTCALCVHGTFPSDDWGTCGALEYEHAKHSGPKRHLSVHRSGKCGGHRLDEEKAAQIGAFREFLEEG